MTVRSTRLFGPTTVTPLTTSVLVTVPSGRTAIVRGLLVSATGAATTTVLVTINTLAWWRGSIPINSSSSLPYLVLNPGDVLRLQNTDAVGTVTVTGAGSLLLGEPG